MALKPVLRSVAALFCLLLTGLISAEVGTPIPPAPTQWVTDESDFLSASARESLDTQLEEYAYASGHQLLIFISQTSGGVPIEDWAVRAFAAWRVGRQGIDDGLVLFIMSQDRTMRIEVGYGLEEVVTDAQAARIINDILVPGIRAGEHDRALSDAVSALLTTIGGAGTGEEGKPPGQEKAAKPMSLGEMILIGILIIGFLILLITNPSLAIYLLFSILSGGRGGGRSGGGGFFGGGGRSGGGGASGSW